MKSHLKMGRFNLSRLEYGSTRSVGQCLTHKATDVIRNNLAQVLLIQPNETVLTSTLVSTIYQQLFSVHTSTSWTGTYNLSL